MIKSESSDVRFLNPKTLEVEHTETMEEFRAKRGRPEFRRDPDILNRVSDTLLVVQPNQEHRVGVTDAIRSINKLSEPVRTIIYDSLVLGVRMAEVGKQNNISYGAVRQIVSRFRKELHEGSSI